MEKKSLEYWQNLAASLRIEGRAFIDGEYRDAASGNTFDCVNPSDGTLLAKVADSGEVVGVELVAGGVIGMQLQGESKFFPRFRQIPLVHHF